MVCRACEDALGDGQADDPDALDVVDSESVLASAWDGSAEIVDSIFALGIGDDVLVASGQFVGDDRGGPWVHGQYQRVIHELDGWCVSSETGIDQIKRGRYDDL